MSRERPSPNSACYRCLVRLMRPPALLVAICLGASPCVGLAAQQADRPVGALAEKIQRRYDTIRDFSADFVQTYVGGVLRTRLTQGGRLFVKKPGMMRWEYKKPEEQLLVSDGVKMYFYVPADKQVRVGSIPKDDRATTPILFLTGKGNLTRDFTVLQVDTPPGLPAGTQSLKLVPKQAEPDYDWLVLSVDPDSMLLRGLTTTDSQGGTSTFSFTNLKENLGLTDKTFEFKIPRGVDIVTSR